LTTSDATIGRAGPPARPGTTGGTVRATKLEARDARIMLYFVLPCLLFMLAVFLYPIVNVIAQSVMTLDGAFTWAGYKDLLSSRLFRKVLLTTFEISFLATIVTVFFAYPVAYHLAKQPPRARAFYMVLVLLPFWTSILVKSFAFTVVLGTDGIINQGIKALLGQDQGVKLLFNRIGVMIGLAHFFIPFMVFPILTSLLAISPDLPKAAQLMGSGAGRIFFRITLPLSMPGVIAGSLLTFILSLGFFVTPRLLGGRQDIMMANLVDLYTRETLNWTLASSISVVLLVLSLILIFVLTRVPGGRQVFGEGH
jgi:putative spermidine/putrescine transport system permease protein